jgi:TonB family protein
MSLILVVEQEGRYIERIHDALTAEGWRVKVVNGREAALQAAASEAPVLVLVNSDLPDGAQLLDQFSRHRGGPGTVALVPERSVGRITAQELGADELLGKPFSDQDLRLLVRRSLSQQREARATPASGGGRQLTSEDIFGDVLAEVESEAPAARAADAARSADSIQRKIDQTLSGLSLPQKAAAKPAAKPAASGGIDKLISDTLSGLESGKPKPAAPKPPVAAAPAPPPVAATPAPPPPAPAPPPVQAIAPPAPPKPSPPTPPITLPPVVVTPVVPPAAAAPPAPPPAPPKAAAPSAPPPKPAAPSVAPPAVAAEAPKKRTSEFDLSQLDELARPRTKTGTSSAPKPIPTATPSAPAAASAGEGFRTQRLPTFPNLTENREFGQYTLLDRIAVGGMAEVWKARMKGVEGFQKTVAIKRILPSLTDSSDFVTMFIDEAKLAAQLQHNNIIHIYDLGKLGDDYYIAMEYIEGKDLRSILNAARQKQLALPHELALMIAARLASALDYAHRKRDFDNRELGLVHRDVSPQNVLISYEGDIKLCDFGIVKAVAKASKTQMGALKGKLQYMSPEQAWGKPVDARSDIFSLGSLLFEMLTGRRLFAGDSEISVLEAVRDCRVEHPQALDLAIPAEVDALVMKALEREPENRFASAGAMQKEIERVQQALRKSPSQADLAGYMHRLFGGESREAAAGASAAVAAAGAPGAAAVLAGTGSQVKPIAAAPGVTGTRVDEAEGKGRGMLWAAIAAAVVLGVALYFFLGRDKGAAPAPAPPAEATAPAAPTTAPETAPAPAPGGAAGTAPSATAGATPPDLGQRVDQAVAEREAQLKQQFEVEKKRIADQIAQTKTAPPAAAPAAKPAVPPAAPAAPAVDPEQERLAAEKAEQERLAAEKAEQDRLAAEKAEQDRLAQEAAAQAAAASAKPAAPAVQLGDLVQPGTPGSSPPALVSRPQPSYPPLAKQMRIEGDVIVEVLVDENGAVANARVAKSVPQLDSSAMAAARSAKFRPATKDGVRVKMWFRLNFPFRM